MGLEVAISEELLTALQNKTDQIGDKLAILGNLIGEDAQNNVMNEAPVITHNLQNATRLESVGPFQWMVYPDEGVAPYALFVILGHMTRPRTVKTGGMMGNVSYGGDQHFVQGNDYFQRGEDLTQSDIENELAEFEDWCNDLN